MTDLYRLSVYSRSVGKYGRSTGTRRTVHLVTDLNDDGWSLCGKRVADIVTKPAVTKVFNRPAPRSASTDTCYYCLIATGQRADAAKAERISKEATR